MRDNIRDQRPPLNQSQQSKEEFPGRKKSSEVWE